MSAAYSPAAADVGSTLRLAVTASNEAGSATAVSAETPVVLPAAPVNTTLPSIAGEAQVGQLLTAAPGAWSDSPSAYAYEWRRCDAAGGGCEPILAAAGSTYLLSPADQGFTVRVAVTASNAGGSATAISAATAPVGAAPAPPPEQPAVSRRQWASADGSPATVTLGQQPTSGNLLVATAFARTGSIPHSLGTGAGNQENVAVGQTTSTGWTKRLEVNHWPTDVVGRRALVIWTKTAGGTEPSTVQASGTHSMLLVQELSGSAAWSFLTAASSDGGAPNGAFTSTTTGSSGSLPDSQLLLVGALAVRHASDSGDGQPPSSLGWSNGLSSSVAQLHGGNQGRYLATAFSTHATGGSKTSTASWTGTGNSGASAALLAFALTPQATPPPPTPPANTDPPEITGTLEVGKTLTSSNGSWTGSPAPTHSRQWRRCDGNGSNCASIPGATGTTYASTTADQGTTLRVDVTATNTAGTVTVTSTQTPTVQGEPAPPPPPPGSGLANLWVHPQSSGTCTRSATQAAYSATTACPNLAAAWNAANASPEQSTVLVRGGTYAGTTTCAFDWGFSGSCVQLNGNRTSANRVVIENAPGETVVLAAALQLGVPGHNAGPDYLTIRGLQLAEFGNLSGAEMTTSRHGIFVWHGSNHVRLENVRAGNVSAFVTDGLHVLGGEFGPCYQTAPQSRRGPCDLNRFGNNTNLTIDGSRFHTYDQAPSCVAAGNCHWRPMFAYGAQGFTLRNSTWSNSVFFPWFTILQGDASAATGNHNILLENNLFGGEVRYSGAQRNLQGGGFQFAWCQNANPGVVAYRNVTVRFNSFTVTGGPELGGATGNWPCAQYENFRIYGNVIGTVSGCWGMNGGYAGAGDVRWRYNLYRARIPWLTTDKCDPTDVSLEGTWNDGTWWSFYEQPTWTPGHTSYRLTGPLTHPDNLVPAGVAGFPCPATDKFGQSRGQGGFCDAGAHER